MLRVCLWLKGVLRCFCKDPVRLGNSVKWKGFLIVCGLGFLDISKLMEYKPPQEDYNLWTRHRAAQRTLLYPKLELSYTGS